MSVLDDILERKRDEVAALRRDPGESALAAAAREAEPARGFAAGLERGEPPRVIAEFKRRSPTRGWIRQDARPGSIATAYQAAGAAALSVLTDERFFGGSLDDLRSARASAALPVLRKDFTLDPIQLVEARAAGADAALLIVAALDDAALKELVGAAAQLGLDALVEVHTRAELERARTAGARLIGINNRDLRTFSTDPQVTRDLLPYTEGCIVVSESGLAKPETLRSLQDAGAHAFLIGEALMAAPDPGAALRALRIPR